VSDAAGLAFRRRKDALLAAVPRNGRKLGLADRIPSALPE
jgi:hypothetical protein